MPKTKGTLEQQLCFIIIDKGGLQKCDDGNYQFVTKFGSVNEKEVEILQKLLKFDEYKFTHLADGLQFKMYWVGK